MLLGDELGLQKTGIIGRQYVGARHKGGRKATDMTHCNEVSPGVLIDSRGFLSIMSLAVVWLDTLLIKG